MRPVKRQQGRWLAGLERLETAGIRTQDLHPGLVALCPQVLDFPSGAAADSHPSLTRPRTGGEQDSGRLCETMGRERDDGGSQLGLPRGLT